MRLLCAFLLIYYPNFNINIICPFEKIDANTFGGACCDLCGRWSTETDADDDDGDGDGSGDVVVILMMMVVVILMMMAVVILMVMVHTGSGDGPSASLMVMVVKKEDNKGSRGERGLREGLHLLILVVDKNMRHTFYHSLSLQ